MEKINKRDDLRERGMYSSRQNQIQRADQIKLFGIYFNPI